MVAAWISAETGVGPAMASGSHTYKGNCALLPIVPPNNSRAAAVTSIDEALPRSWPTTPMFEVVKPVAAINAKMPNVNGTSPIRVVMKALIAEPELTGSSYQWPINRYEQTPMTSQPTRSWNRLLAKTTTSIAPVNSDSTTKNQV